ncbi:MAG: Mg/Co/Ni transporter MgtE with domain [Firmicutes bacterium]|nr:Mg/Co/Ni transporter MgtE with domain [Bacillota bacterium]
MMKVQVLGEFFFSQVIGKKIYDAEGIAVGKVCDMVVRWDGDSPTVTCIQFKKGAANHLDISKVDQWNKKGLVLKGKWNDADARSLHEREFCARKWLLDKQIIDLNGSKLVRVNDITLSWIDYGDHKDIVLGSVDIGIRGLFRRLGLEFLVVKCPQNFVGWQHIKPIESKLDNLHLRSDFEKLNKLHPADIADIIEDLNHDGRNDLIEGLGNEKAANVLVEVDFDTQVKIIESMDSQRASDILEEMPADEVADILGELSDEKSSQLLRLMEPEDAREVRELMTYAPETAGALMTTEYVSFDDDLTADETIQELRENAEDAETIYYIYVVDAHEILQGVLSLRELIIAKPQAKLKEIMHARIITIDPMEKQSKAVDMVSKYGLIALPVVNDANQLLGIITIDDVIETIVPDRSERKKIFNFMRFSRKVWTK